MLELDEKTFNERHTDFKEYVLFITSPFCGTCQLAEHLLNIARESLDPSFNIYKCRVSEWPELVKSLEIQQVPCLLKKEKNGQWKVLYAFESVTKIYCFLQ